jgi:hypothetical protein
LQSSKQHSKTYAGIGSRETPVEVQQKMTEIASRLSRIDYVLYSGGAEGADSAFERGAEQKVIFLPWDNFNGRKVNEVDYVQPPGNLDLVKQFHPNYHALGGRARALMSRNSYQVLGPDLQSPVEFVLCWTKDGNASGGTGQALRIAKDYNIPIFNFYTGYKEFANYMERTILFA